MNLKEKLKALPKVELHNHLEGGSMYPDLALKFAVRNGYVLPFKDMQSAKAYYQFTSLDQFIDILRTTVATLNTAEDYADAVERQGMEAKRQHIRYHELFVTYGLVAPRGVAWEVVVEGLLEGRKRNKEKHGVDTAFIIDLDRTLPEDEAYTHTQLAIAAKKQDDAAFVGMGLDCQENGYPAKRLERCYQTAKANGLRLTAHAGEDGGSESVWQALDCGVERIDHGVQSVSDPRLMAHLADNNILLTVCPISNIALKVFPSMAEHSLPKLVEAGIPVCLNSDDPPMFNCDLLTEFEVVEQTFSFSESTLITMARNAIEHSFQTQVGKQELLQEFDATLASFESPSSAKSNL